MTSWPIPAATRFALVNSMLLDVPYHNHWQSAAEAVITRITTKTSVRPVCESRKNIRWRRAGTKFPSTCKAARPLFQMAPNKQRHDISVSGPLKATQSLMQLLHVPYKLQKISTSLKCLQWIYLCWTWHWCFWETVEDMSCLPSFLTYNDILVFIVCDSWNVPMFSM